MTHDRRPFANFIENATRPDPNTFEYQLMKHICENLAWNCIYLPIFNLDDRVNWLNSGRVDVVITKFSVTQQRAYRVRFVFPYYYADSAAVFELRGDDTRQEDSGAMGL